MSEGGFKDKQNVDSLVSENGIYSNGLMKHNKFHVDMNINANSLSGSGYSTTISNLPVFAARVPGWDVGTVLESGVRGNVKTFPYRKNWTQQLFITFYMENEPADSMYNVINTWCNAVVHPSGIQPYYDEAVAGSSIDIYNGHEDQIQWKFYQVYPRVLYPIELKPVEDFAPMVFSVQFVYRSFDIYSRGNLIGTNSGPLSEQGS
tara:strand:+ start:229 stop:843 length:615 start_codon:yes stop_codon:yes gene_type:complete